MNLNKNMQLSRQKDAQDYLRSRFNAARYNNNDVRQQSALESNLNNLSGPSGLTDTTREGLLNKIRGGTTVMSPQEVQSLFSTPNNIQNSGTQGTGAWRSVFRPGNAVTSYADLQAAAPGPYRNMYQPAMQATMNSLLNAQPFQYDVNADGLYQQIKDGYIKQGRQAMMDTMGQSAALTGGYGNSYGVTAGNQAYQESLGNLAGVIPELAQLAYSQYKQGQDDQRNNLEAMYKLENSEYQRWLTDANAYQKALKDAPLDLSAAEASGMGGGGGAYFSGYGPTIITPNTGTSSSNKLNMDQWAAWQELFNGDPNQALQTFNYLKNGNQFANGLDRYTGMEAARYWMANNGQKQQAYGYNGLHNKYNTQASYNGTPSSSQQLMDNNFASMQRKRK
jgi:hypothetical protein